MEPERDARRGIGFRERRAQPARSAGNDYDAEGCAHPRILEVAMSSTRHDQDDGADFAKNLADLTKVSLQRRTNNPCRRRAATRRPGRQSSGLAKRSITSSGWQGRRVTGSR